MTFTPTNTAGSNAACALKDGANLNGDNGATDWIERITPTGFASFDCYLRLPALP